MYVQDLGESSIEIHFTVPDRRKNLCLRNCVMYFYFLLVTAIIIFYFLLVGVAMNKADYGSVAFLGDKRQEYVGQRLHKYTYVMAKKCLQNCIDDTRT